MMESPGAARAAGVDEKIRDAPSAAAPTALVAVFATAKPWQPGHPEQLGLPQNAAAVARTANTHSLIFEVCCAVDLVLLKSTKCVPSRASCAMASPPEF